MQSFTYEQSMGSQRVKHNLATKQQQQRTLLPFQSLLLLLLFLILVLLYTGHGKSPVNHFGTSHEPIDQLIYMNLINRVAYFQIKLLLLFVFHSTTVSLKHVRL